MNRDSVLELQEDVLKAFDKRFFGHPRAMALIESEVASTLDKRLAVGYSVHGKKDYRLEVRLQRKGGPAQAYAEQLIETHGDEVNVVVVDVVSTPAHVDVPATADAILRKEQRPLRPGVSISRVDARAGTLGVIVETEDGDPAILSAGHVIAQSGDAEEGDWIYQPGKPDTNPLSMKNRIARLANSVELSTDELNSLDVAIAHLRGAEHAGNELPKLDCPVDNKTFDKVWDVKELEALGREAIVAKIGRTTGYTEGVLSALQLRRLSVRTARGNHNFGGIFEVTWKDKPFTKPGDSGACVFALDGPNPFGIHFASDATKRSYACSLAGALKHFNVTMI